MQAKEKIYKNSPEDRAVLARIRKEQRLRAKQKNEKSKVREAPAASTKQP